jgi:3'-phosphoadenosine 5'-phosphosulfate sulfotransferase (PAPS reductase)/FAD synthetase
MHELRYVPEATRGKTLPVLAFTPIQVKLPTSISCVVVSISGGKDSSLSLLRAVGQFGQDLVIAVHMEIEEDWPGTIEHCQRVCSSLGVRLYTCKAHYFAMWCRMCGNHHIALDPEQAWCRACGAHDSATSHVIENVHQIIAWRGMYPSLEARLCTSMLKRDTFNIWARGNAGLLGKTPVVISGERHKESRGRAKLPTLRYRSTLRQEWMLEYRNVLDCSRREVFCELRDAEIPLHPCYDGLWREMLVLAHEDWRAGDYRLDKPHSSYPGQWDGLYEACMIPEPVLNRMISTLKYEVDEEEGGPRCSCRDCWLLSPILHRAAYRLEQKLGIERPAHQEALLLEKSIGHRMTDKASLEDMLIPPYKKREPQQACQLALPFFCS